MNIGLFFGSFNPVHNGHMAIAQYFEQSDVLDEVWMVVTPVNPFKDKTNDASDVHRLEMCKMAVENTNIKICEIEFEMEAPHYTYITLQLLRSMHTDHRFNIIIGDDNLSELHLWKNYEDIIVNHEIMIYPRGEGDTENERISNYSRYNAPLISWSSTSVRELIGRGEDVNEIIPLNVLTYIRDNALYLTQ